MADTTAEPAPPLVITEIMQDNAGTPGDQDYFEFFEVHNTTDAALDLNEFDVRYNNPGTTLTVVEEGTDNPLAEAVIPAGETAVFWLRYGVGSGDTRVEQWDLVESDFRAHFGNADSDYALFHVTGQGGFANSGYRPLRIWSSDGSTLVTESWYERQSADKGNSDHFSLPAEGVVLSHPVAGTPTPGVVDPAQLVRPEPEPEPEPAAVQGNDGNASAVSRLVITEIAGDNPGADNWEYLEVTNTTDQPIDLAAEGIEIRYHTSQWNDGTPQPLIHLDGEGDSPAVIPAGGIALFWMNYGEGDSRRDLTKAQFRTFYGIDEDVPLFRFGPQGGFANGGNRGFSIADADGTIARAWVPADDGNSSTPWNAQFAVPDMLRAIDARLVEYTHGTDIVPTPGAITIEQVTSALIRESDPDLTNAPILQITEIAPDTNNVSGADAYEFVEVYNASDAPVNWADYTLAYLYTNNSLDGPHTNSSTLWPSVPTDVIIEPGKTLVLWVKNGAVVDAGLTVADFNREFGSDLVLGESIVEMFNGGMSNGGSRGIQVLTNTGFDVSRAYYFNDDQTTPSTAIQYGWNPGGAGNIWTPNPVDGTVQTLIGLATPTPGSVSANQVPNGLAPAPAAGTAPVIVDLTGSDDAPATDGVDFLFRVTDDVLVRSVNLTVTDNRGTTDERQLTASGADNYSYSLPEADLYGKRWIEYTVTASDGAQTTTRGPVRINLIEGDVDPLRLNLTEGQYVGGDTRVVATTEGDPAGLAIAIDGTPLAPTTRSLEANPIFAFEATATDAFFRNGVLLGDEVLTIFDEGYYSRIETVDASVPVEKIVAGEKLTVTIAAGTKAWPGADPNENNDDFTALNFRLALPDGRVLRTSDCAITRETGGAESELIPYTCPTDSTSRVGFSDAGLVTLHLTYTIPEDAFGSIAGTWDTTAVADGEHPVTATSGADTVTRTVVVDNTAPTLTSTIEDGQLYRGSFEIDAQSTDAGSGVASLSASLNGEAIALPANGSSLEFEAGEHTLVLTATDAVGNEAVREIAFRTADEQPSVTPGGDDEAEEGSVTLEATVDSAEGDLLDVSFREGYLFTPVDDAVSVLTGTTTASRDTERSGATALTAERLADLVGVDGVDVEVSSDMELPYQLFTVAVPEDAGDGASVRATWTGSANAEARVTLYALTVEGNWAKVDEHLTLSETDFELAGVVPTADFAVDGVVTFLVQHSEGFAGTPRSSRESTVTPYHAEATPRSAYDFTIGWESDTQYYNRNEGWRAGTGGSDVNYQHQLNIHDFFLAERDNLNLQYMVHTGDIVDDVDEFQWQNADDAYRLLDNAGLPYGVLAGNHDVRGAAADYTTYGQYFGESRFAANPWYGGSYKNNRGHYDLISANGLDLLVIYIGWPDAIENEASNSQDIAWLNSVIQDYPERKVWINLHEYMLTTGGLGPYPQRIFDEVVAPNPNVFAVGSGHYHDAYTREDQFDDDGDGVTDRTVTSMLFDYQALAEGGLGYLRLLHFDNEQERIMVRTYSPSLDVFNSTDPGLMDPPGMQEFEIAYAKGGLEAVTKTLTVDAFSAEVLTTKEIGSHLGVPSGSTVTVEWDEATLGEHGWYVVVTGPHGGEVASPVTTLTVVAASGNGGNETPGGGDGDGGAETPGGGDGDGDGGTETPGGGDGDGDGGTETPGGGDGDGDGGTETPGGDNTDGSGGTDAGNEHPVTGVNAPWGSALAGGVLVLLGVAFYALSRRRSAAVE